jgi:hypothetical protein
LKDGRDTQQFPIGAAHARPAGGLRRRRSASQYVVGGLSSISLDGRRRRGSLSSSPSLG